MKTLIIITFFIFSAVIGLSQVDYSIHPEFINTKKSIVKVDWLQYSPKDCLIDFNHLVSFININDDKIYGSKIMVELYHNDKLVRGFNFSTGDNIVNRIYLGDPIKLKKGDNVYFLFRLESYINNEQYVFNIYEEKRAVVKTVMVKNEISNNKPEIKSIKTVKHKSLSDRHFRKLQRRDIGKEI